MTIKYFLLIDGLNGGSTAPGHEGWFEIDSFDFDINDVIAASTGTGAGEGKVTFSPLTVQLSLSDGLAGVLKDTALGTVIPSVRIEGVTDGANPVAVYDLTLGHVQITNAHDSSGPNDSLTLNYGQVALSTKVQNPDGTTAPGENFSYDVAAGHVDASIPTPSVGPSTGEAPTPAKYFLLIDGLNGGSTDAQHVGWFEIDSFDFDINDVIATATGTGAGEGKVTFSPLTVQLSLDPGLAGALRDVATGHDIGAIKLEGVTAQGQAVYDLTLAHASVTQLHEGNGGHDSLSFDYQQLGLITQVQQPNGSTAPGESFGYDVAKNLVIDPATLPVPSAHGGNPLTAELVSGTSHGALTLNPDGSFVYVPDANFNGTDSFVYHANDGTSNSNDVTVQINVSPVNDAPVITSPPAHVVLTETNAPLSATGQIVFTDVDIGDTPTASVDLGTVVATATGVNLTDSQKASLIDGFSITNPADGHWAYSIASPDFLPAGSSVELSYPVTVDDHHGGTANQAVTITIDGTNDAPLAFHDIAGVHPQATITADAAHGVLANDTDPDIGDLLSVTAMTFNNTTSPLSGGHVTVSGSFGSLTLDSDGSYSYSANKLPPNTNVAQDTFSYTVNDGHGGTAQSTLTVTIANDQYIAATPGETVAAGNSKQVIDGGLGDVKINGGNGADVLIGGPHDTLTGGNGPDTYVFGPGFGPNVITDFDVHNDQIQIDHSLFPSVSAVIAHTTDNAQGNAVITYDPNDTITFIGVSQAQLAAHPSDFHIV